MKTLFEIIEICKSGKTPDINDARYAICAMDSLMCFDSSSFKRMVQLEQGGRLGKIYTAMKFYEESFNRKKIALNKQPLEWLGEDYNPDNPENQKRRKQSIKFVEKFIKNRGK